MLVDMDGRADMLMRRVVTVGAGRSNFNLGLWLRVRGFTSNVAGLEDHRETLAGRRRDAFGRAFIFDWLMSTGTLGTKVIHADDGVDDRQCRASGVKGWTVAMRSLRLGFSSLSSIVRCSTLQ